MLVADLLQFVAESWRHGRSTGVAPAAGGVWRQLRHFRAWRQALRGATPLDDARPWITFDAIGFLERSLHRAMRVFEWGSGGSTLFLAARVGEVISIEHDRSWYERVCARLGGAQHARGRLELIEPQPGACASDTDPADPNGYASADPRYAGFSFERYVRAIDAFPDAAFDLILIDGRARPACLRHALPKVRVGGWIMLDNTERAHYGPAAALLDVDFRRSDFAGAIPYLVFFVRTTVWQRLR